MILSWDSLQTLIFKGKFLKNLQEYVNFLFNLVFGCTNLVWSKKLNLPCSHFSTCCNGLDQTFRNSVDSASFVGSAYPFFSTLVSEICDAYICNRCSMCPIDKTKNRNHDVYCSDSWYHCYCSSYIGIYFNIRKISMTFKRISSLIFCQSVSFNHQETKLWWKCTTNPFSFSLLSAYYKLCLLLNSLLRRGKVDWLSS